MLISDHPIWLADALGQPVIALPDESPADVATLAADFGSSYLVVFDERGDYPAVLLDGPAAACFDGAEPYALRCRRPRLALPDHPGVPAVTHGDDHDTPYTRATMEMGTLGERRQAEFDTLYAEAKQALGAGANQLRMVTERLRQAYAADLLEYRQARRPTPTRRPTHGSRRAGPRKGPAVPARVDRSRPRAELALPGAGHDRRLEGNRHDVPRTSPSRNPAARRGAMQILEAQERERAQVAEELHDGPAQALSNASFQVEIIDRAMRRIRRPTPS